MDDGGNIVRFSVNSRIMIDAAFFAKVNPNYFRPHITEPADLELEFESYITFMFHIPESKPADEIQSSKKLAEITENDLLTCCPTVPGFSLNNKI